MAEPQRTVPRRQQAESLPALISELRDLVVAYAKQETIDPLKALGRFVAFGLAGAVCISLGTFLVALGGLRALQTTEHLEGNWSWLPYLIVVAFCLIVAGIAASRIAKAPRRRNR